MKELSTLKVLIVGDCNIGKTSLLLKYLLKNSEDNRGVANSEANFNILSTYKPTTLSIYKCQVEINLKIHNILFTDHNGRSDMDKLTELRKYSYIYENVIIIFIFKI